MLKPLVFFTAFALLLGGSNLVQAQSGKQNTSSVAHKDLKFLEEISIEPAGIPAAEPARPQLKNEASYAAKKDIISLATSTAAFSIEKATALHFKYAMLLDMEVELIKNLRLFKLIDEWYGVKYRFGGSSKAGIDCSALMQIFFTALYGIALPRTAKEQFHFTRRISLTELREGDLVFFNTRGGISHVGMYLANNKFVHAATSGGVMISDLFEDYFSRRFVGAGRVEGLIPVSAFNLAAPRP